MYVRKDIGTGETLLLREESEIRLALYRVTQRIREIYESLSGFSATRESLLEEARMTENNERVERLLELLSDGVTDAESELASLGEEFARLTEELDDSLWYIKREGNE